MLESVKFSDSLIVVYVYSALPVVTKFNVCVYLVRGYERDRTVFTFLLFIQNRTQRKMVSISRLWFTFATSPRDFISNQKIYI